MDPDEFVEALDDGQIVAAIARAESRSRAEVRVHVADGVIEDVERAAAETFERLGMTRTAERNGVLLFVAPECRRFAVLGDTAIHELCGQAFWSAVTESMAQEFRAFRFTEGIVAGIETVGEVLARNFPRRPGEVDVNELPDSVSRD